MAVFTAKDKIQEIKDRESKIVVLKDECTVLNEVQAENTQFITKINEFLGTPKS